MTFEEMKNLPEDEQKKLFEEIDASRKKGKSCLPIDNTEVLTSNGWKYFDEICVGDDVLSLNTSTGLTEFCKVQDKIFIENAEVTLMRNHNWGIESTADHRWYTERVTGRGHTVRKVRSYQTTENLKKQYSIVSSAKYVGGSSEVTPQEAAFVSWVLSDGYLKVSELHGRTGQGAKGENQGFNLSISQSKGKYYEEVKKCIEDLGLGYHEYLNNSGVNVFQMRAGQARDLWKRLGLPLKSKHDIDYTQWVLSLSAEALESFFDAFWKADGNTAKTGTMYKTKIIYQNRGAICDAVQLCSELLGRNCLVSGKNKIRSLSCQDRRNLTLQKVLKTFSRESDVFCLTTENGNFVIRQDGFITITGNCNYASVYNAGPPTIARAAGVSEEEGKTLHEGYWKLNWAVKAVAEDQYVFEDSMGSKWLVNPINGFCYSLRKESDRFSTLAQGSGAFIFDMWLNNIQESLKEVYSTERLSLQAHDELVVSLRDKEPTRKMLEKITQESLEKVNKDFYLRRAMGCDVQFGKRYSDIH